MTTDSSASSQQAPQQQQQQQQNCDDSNSTPIPAGPKTRKRNIDKYADNREKFFKDLLSFHEARNTPITRLPRISGREIDLHKLYQEVVSRGGWLKVNLRNEWDEVVIDIGLPQRCVNSTVALKTIYARYLDKYEKLVFLGEDPDRSEEPDDDAGPRHKKWSSAKSYQMSNVPMSYNYNQHVVPEHSRILNKLSTDMYNGSEYEKLMLALMSPLPNEQDFGINVCILMANESKHTLKIEHCVKLVDCLIAHAGVYSHYTMRTHFKELYENIRRHSQESFWKDLLHSNSEIFKLSYDDKSENDEKNAIFENMISDDSGFYDQTTFLSLGRGLGTQDYIGQRVQQITSIMRNLSFLDENIQVLSKNRTFLRFLVMCSNIRWGNIHNMALDISGNIATELDLLDPTTDNLTRCLLATICDGLEGQDRGVILSSLEILAKLAQRDKNDNHLHKCLDQKIYNQISLFLSLNDIMLLIYTLECIYSLTSLGGRSCNYVIQIQGIVDTLVSLITVEAQSYGPDGCILMRVVETVPGNMLPIVAQNIANLQNVTMQQSHQIQFHHQHQQQHQMPSPSQIHQKLPLGNQSVTQNLLISKKIPVIPQVQQHSIGQSTAQENEQFAISWLTATFEIVSNSPTSRVEQQELYKMYLSAAQKSNRKGAVTPSHFPRIVRSIFGSVVGPQMIKQSDSTKKLDNSAFYYVCMRVRANPLPLKGSIQIQQQQQHQTQKLTPKSVVQQTQFNNENATNINNENKHEITNEPEEVNQQSQQIINSVVISQTIPTGNQEQSVIQAAINEPVGNSSIISSNNNISNESGHQTSTSLIKSLLANKVTSTTTASIISIIPNTVMSQSSSTFNNNNKETTVTSAAASANTINNSSCLTNNSITTSIITTQNIMHQLAQRQSLAKQKDAFSTTLPNVQQQQTGTSQQIGAISVSKQSSIIHSTQSQTSAKLPTTTISALVNNPIQPTAVKVGQTTIKPINPNAIDKKMLQVPSEKMENFQSTWDSVPPLAPLSNTSSSTQLRAVSGAAGAPPPLLQTDESQQIAGIISDNDNATVMNFEEMFVPKTKSTTSSNTDDENSKDSVLKVSGSSSRVINSNQMLVDLLDKKSPEPPQLLVGGIKRKLITSDESGNEKKKTISELPVTPSKNAANLYAELAQSLLEGEDLDVPTANPPPTTATIQAVQKPAEQKQTLISVPVQQRQIIVQGQPGQQIILQQTASQSNAQPAGTATIKTESGIQTVPVILQQQIGGQVIQQVLQKQQSTPNQNAAPQFVLATNPQGQTFLVQQQSTSVSNSNSVNQQQQPQAVFVTQQQQQGGAPTKTIIIVQQQTGQPPAVVPSGAQQKVIMTAQGQQMIVMPRQQLMLNPATGQIYQQQPQPTQQQITQQQQQQQATILSQLPQIPATIKLHTQQPAPPVTQVIQNVVTPNNMNAKQGQTVQIISQPQTPATTKIVQQIVRTPIQAQQKQIFVQQHVVSQPAQAQIQGQPTSIIQQQKTLLASQQITKSTASVTKQIILQQTPQKQTIMMNPQTGQPQGNVLSQQMMKPASPIPQSTLIQSKPNQYTQNQGTVFAAQSNTEQSSIQETSQNPQAIVKQITASQVQIPNNSTPIPSNIQQPLSPVLPRAGTPLPSYPQRAGTPIPSHPQRAGTPVSINSSHSPILSRTSNTPPVINPSSPANPAISHSPIPQKQQVDDDDLSYMWICDWRGCPRIKYPSLQELYRHACKIHCPENLEPGAEIFCQWGGAHASGLCDGIPRKRYSLMTHLQDRHCTIESLKLAVQKRLTQGLPVTNQSQPVTIIKSAPDGRNAASSPALSTSSSGSVPSAGSAAMQAIKRHSGDYTNPKELTDENEGPVTKSIRLTAALILRNLITYTTVAKRHLRQYEPHLSNVALSNVESSRTISHILYELNN